MSEEIVSLRYRTQCLRTPTFSSPEQPFWCASFAARAARTFGCRSGTQGLARDTTNIGIYRHRYHFRFWLKEIVCLHRYIYIYICTYTYTYICIRIPVSCYVYTCAKAHTLTYKLDVKLFISQLHAATLLTRLSTSCHFISHYYLLL